MIEREFLLNISDVQVLRLLLQEPLRTYLLGRVEKAHALWTAGHKPESTAMHDADRRLRNLYHWLTGEQFDKPR